MTVSNEESLRTGLTPWGLRLRQGGFASIRLNPSTWLALLSPGVVLGLLVARLTNGSFVVWGLLGGIAVWIAAVTIDRVVAGNRRNTFSIATALSARQLDSVVADAAHAGIRFDHKIDKNSGSSFTTKTKFVPRLKNIIEVTSVR